jgi:hypothetical protein
MYRSLGMTAVVDLARAVKMPGCSPVPQKIG